MVKVIVDLRLTEAVISTTTISTLSDLRSAP